MQLSLYDASIPTMISGLRNMAGFLAYSRDYAGRVGISRYKLVRNNWFAYNPMRLNIGSIARWQGDSDVLVSPEYVVLRCLERSTPAALHPGYLDHFRKSRQWDAFVNEAGDGGVRVRIYYRDITTAPASATSPGETNPPASGR